LKFKKTFDFVWTIHIETISYLFEDMGLNSKGLEQYSYHPKTFWKKERENAKTDLRSEEGRKNHANLENNLISLDENLTIGGVSISGEFHKSGMEREKTENESLLATPWYSEGYDAQNFVDEENIHNFLKYLRLIERNIFDTKKSSWLGKVISEINDKNVSNENILNTDVDNDEVNNKEIVPKQNLDSKINKSRPEKKIKKKAAVVKETNAQSNRVAALIEQAMTEGKDERTTENGSKEIDKSGKTIVKEERKPEIIEIEIEIEKVEDNSLIITGVFPKLPYEIAYKSIEDKEDPLEIIRTIGDDFIDKDEEGKSHFREMRWGWNDEIDRKWLELDDDSDGKIALIAARQYLIDKHKQLDRFEKDKLSNSELTDHRANVQSLFKEMKEHNLTWINRALMPK